MVCSSKFIHLREKGATACFWPVCVKGKNEESSQSQKSTETSPLATFCMGIKEMWLVHQNPSIYVKRGPPCVSGLGRNEGSSQSQKCIETSSLAKFCMGIQEMMLAHQNPSTCTKREPPCVSGLVLSKGGMKSLLTVPETNGNFLPCEVLHWDSRNVVSSSKFFHLREK